MAATFRENALGALFMSGSMASFTLNDTLMKALSSEWPFFQAVFVRSLIATTLIGLIAWRRGFGWGAFLNADWRMVALRTASEVGAAYFFIMALFHMPLANITAIIQALPLTVTLAGALFLGEPIGWRRIGAILVGGVGMLLIVRPWSETFDIWTIYGVLSVVCVTVRDITARRLNARVPTMTVAFLTALSIGVFSGTGAVFIDWAPATTRALLLVAGAGLTIIGGYIFSIQVMRQGDIAFTVPFRYTSLIWALILGWLVFGDWPKPLTFIGAAIVVATGLFTFWRERVASRAAR